MLANRNIILELDRNPTILSNANKPLQQEPLTYIDSTTLHVKKSQYLFGSGWARVLWVVIRNVQDC